MSNTNTEVLTTAYEKLQGAITQANTVLPELEEAVEKGNLDNYATTSQLEEKANEVDLQTQKARIDSFTTLEEGSTTGDAELIDARTVNGKTYANAGGAIRAISSGEAIKTKSITPNKTSFIKVNDVIELKDKVIDGLLNTTDGTIDTTDTSNKYTEFINISNYIGKYIVSSVPCIACFYTSDKTFISGLGNLNGTASRQVPSNTKYIIVGMTNTNYEYGLTSDGGIIIEFFDTAQTDVAQIPYKAEKRELKDINVDFNYVENFKLANRVIENNAISKDAVRIDNVDFIVKDSNYIVFTDYLKDGVLDYTTGAITEGGGTEYYSSPIYVGDKQGKFITGCATIKVAFLKDNGIFISGLANLNGTSNRKIPDNAVYAVFGLTNQNYNYSISNYNKVGVQISDVALTTTLTSFEAFEDNKLKNVKIDYNDVVNIPDGALDTDFYKYIFRKGICIGDSITEGYREAMVDKYKLMSYPYYLSKFLDCEVVNGGESGATAIRWWTTNFSKYNYADYNFAIIKLGQNAGLTDTLDTDVTGDDYTAYADTNTGDYCKIIEGIKAQNPSIKIYLITIQSLDTDVNTTTNNVIKQIASKYNLPVIDLDAQSINLRDSNKYHCGEDDAYFGVHFNTIGYMTLAKIISEDIKKHILNNYKNYKNLTF